MIRRRDRRGGDVRAEGGEVELAPLQQPRARRYSVRRSTRWGRLNCFPVFAAYTIMNGKQQNIYLSRQGV